MSDLRAAAQQALEAIDRALPHAPHCGEFDALADMADAIRAALAEPTCKEGLQVEPVAWMDIDPDGQRLSVRMWSDGNRDEVPLYTAPPQRPVEPVQEPVGYFSVNDYGRWEENENEYGTPLYTAPPQRRPLTDEEISKILDDVLEGGSLEDVARAIERAHGIGKA